MRAHRPVLVLTALVALALPAAAEQIIHFTNGTSMPIRAHEIRGDMVHIDLGGDAFMAFPYDKVESIVEAGKNVLLPASSANQMGTTASGRKSATLKAAPTIERQKIGNNQSTQERNGVIYHTPFADSSNPVKASLGMAGNARAREAMRLRNQVEVGAQPQARQGRTVLPGYRERQFRGRDSQEITTLEFAPKGQPVQPQPAEGAAGSEGGTPTPPPAPPQQSQGEGGSGN